MPKIRKHERILNCLPSHKREEDWSLNNALASRRIAAEPHIPDKVDLREKWWSVGDQEDTGSCVGWATADSVLRWHLVKAGRLNPETALSPRFIWMASKETDIYTGRPTTFIESDGTFLKAALDSGGKMAEQLALARAMDAEPARDGYYIDMDVYRGLKDAYAPDRVTPRKLALVGEPPAGSAWTGKTVPAPPRYQGPLEFHDPWDPDAARRYKTLVWPFTRNIDKHGGIEGGAGLVACSPDGVDWQRMPGAR